MRKLSALMLAAATALTVAAAPITAQAACYSGSSYVTSCNTKSISQVLSQYGCNTSASKASNCKTSNSCSKSSNNCKTTRNCKTTSRSCSTSRCR